MSTKAKILIALAFLAVMWVWITNLCFTAKIARQLDIDIIGIETN